MRPSFGAILVATALAVLPAFGQVPVNDDPAGAIALSTGVNPAAPSGSDAAFFTNDGATDTAGLATCLVSQPRRDVFFTYVAPQTGHVVFALCHPAGLEPGTLHTAQIHVYDAAGTILLGCDAEACGPGGGIALGACHFSAVANVAYLVRVGTFTPPPAFGPPAPATPAPTTGSFRVTVTPVVAASDAPAAAVPLPSLDGAIAGSTIGATASFAGPPPTSCMNAGTEDLWYAFTPASAGLWSFEVHLPRLGAVAQPFPPVGVATAAQVYDASGGPGALVSVACGEPKVGGVAGEATVAAGTPCLLRLAKSGGFGFRFLLTTRFRSGTAPPANSSCGAAAAIGAGEHAGSLAGAPPFAPFPAFNARTVWYAFTPTTSGVGRVHAVGANVAVLDGSCGTTVLADSFGYFSYAAGTPLRLAVFGLPGRGFRFRLQFDDPPTPNATSATPTPLFDGANPPFPPGGPYAYFSTSLPPVAGPLNATFERAWFTYVATGDGASFETCPAPGTPPGTAPGAEIALFDANLAPRAGAVDAAPCDGTHRIATLTTPGELLYVGVRAPRDLASLRRAGGTFTLRVGRAASGVLGAPCPNGAAATFSASPPVMGATARLAFQQATSGAGATVVVFVGPRAAPPLSLALPVGYPGVGACAVHVDVFSPYFLPLATLALDNNGAGALDLPIPVVPALDGFPFAMQAAYALTSGPYVGSLALTNGVAVVFGL